MSIWDRVVEIANKAMNTEADQILYELRATCPKRTGKTARSFHIMSADEDATRSVGGKGLITKVRIGSTELTALYADEGNGRSGSIIRSKRAVDSRGVPPGKLKLADGSFRTQVHSYEGTEFVRWVADRHR